MAYEFFLSSGLLTPIFVCQLFCLLQEYCTRIEQTISNVGKNQNFQVKITRLPISCTWLSGISFEEQLNHTSNIPSGLESLLLATRPQRLPDRFTVKILKIGTLS